MPSSEQQLAGLFRAATTYKLHTGPHCTHVANSTMLLSGALVRRPGQIEHNDAMDVGSHADKDSHVQRGSLRLTCW